MKHLHEEMRITDWLAWSVATLFTVGWALLVARTLLSGS